MNQVLVQEEVDRLFKLLNENDVSETVENSVSVKYVYSCERQRKLPYYFSIK